MRQFDYTAMPKGLLTQETMNLLAAVHECRGRQESDLSVGRDVLDALVEVARVQSAGASNRIEGIRTSDARLRGIMEERTDPRSRDEEEIAGYRDVLATIHEGHDYIEPTPGVILQLHRDMYRHTPLSGGGRFKDSDNEIVGIRADGSRYVRFRPVLPWRPPTPWRGCARPFARGSPEGAPIRCSCRWSSCSTSPASTRSATATGA